MCGLAGIATLNGAAPDGAVLTKLTAALLHRGPDGTGSYLKNGVAFVHTRLSIIDLETGDQPLQDSFGNTLMGNGEIYNHVELRQAQSGSVNQRTKSDMEPALHHYRGEGAAASDRLRGMYTLAVHRPDDGDLFLVRDPFGIKPLYYMENGQGLVFASEPQALFAAGLAEPKLVPDRRDELIQNRYTTGRETIFDGIARVQPGETLRIRNGRIEERQVRPSLPDPGPPPVSDPDEAVERFDSVLEDSVLVHQRSDVPYGMFLSGGLDSAATLAMMARLNDEPVRTITCGFPRSRVHDEREAARQAAKAFGAEHTEIEFDEQDFWQLLPEIAASLDDPTLDPAILPTYKLGRTARELDVKVILSGEGGDEILAGYRRYRRLMRPRWLGGRAPRTKGNLMGLGVLRNEGTAWADSLQDIRRDAGAQGRTALQAAQATDIAAWLPCDLLLKLDRCLMAHGVEGRTPFLDPEMADFAFNLPDGIKVRQGHGKWILRKWLEKHCPVTDAFAKKRGFNVPVGEWIRHRGKDLGPLVADQPAIAEICHREAVVDLFRSDNPKHGMPAWSLLFYAAWSKRYLEGERPASDLFGYLKG